MVHIQVSQWQINHNRPTYNIDAYAVFYAVFYVNMPDFHVDVQQEKRMIIKASLCEGSTVISKVFVRYWPFVCIKYVDDNCRVLAGLSRGIRVRGTACTNTVRMLRSDIAYTMGIVAPQQMVEVDNHLQHIEDL